MELSRLMFSTVAVLLRCPASRDLTEANMEGHFQNARAVWTTWKTDSADCPGTDFQPSGPDCGRANNDGERKLSGNTGFDPAPKSAEWTTDDQIGQGRFANSRSRCLLPAAPRRTLWCRITVPRTAHQLVKKPIGWRPRLNGRN